MKRSSGKSQRRCRLSTSKFAACSLPLVLIWLWLPWWWTPADMAPDLLPMHDPYYLRKHPIPFSSNVTGVCDAPPGEGEEGPTGIQALYKIRRALPDNVPDDVPSTKLLCMVYTHSGRHDDVIRAIAETYASHCDGFLAASNLTDPSIGAYHVPHFGSESYDNMWNKVQAMWFFTYQNFVFDFDWFHIGGDDMYVIPENIKRVAAKHPPAQPWYLGSSIPNSKNPKRRYCGGGAGYTLNRRALHLLVSRFASGECPSALASDEDVRVGRCLEDAGFACQDTNDEMVEVRYHHLDAQFHASWIPSRPALWLWEKLYYFHNIQSNQSKLAQISSTSTSFHLDKGIVRSKSRDRGIRRYHAILYNMCGPEFARQVGHAATSTEEERDVLRKHWEQLPKAADAKFG